MISLVASRNTFGEILYDLGTQVGHTLSWNGLGMAMFVTDGTSLVLLLCTIQKIVFYLDCVAR